MDIIITILISLISGSFGAILTILIEGYRTKLKIISRIRETQLTLYSELWASLYDLKLSGDRLWENASIANLKSFVKQLQETELKNNKSSLLIEENNIKSLRGLIVKFWNFQIGKKRLIELRQGQNQYRDLTKDMIKNTIETNRQIKEQYERLIEEIESSLRKQLRTV